jgi:hypothetical protein
MSQIALDLSFERGGRSLADWLPDLVADDRAARLAAGEALKAMCMGIPSVHTSLREIDWKSAPGFERQGERFGEAVRAAARGRGFPTHDFVRRLIARRIAVSDDWMARVERDLHQPRSVAEERIRNRLAVASTEAERIEAGRRFTRWLRASLARKHKRGNPNFKGAEAITSAGSMAMMVFDALDSSLLTDREGLRRMLAHKDLCRDAARALARIGPAAADFVTLLLDQLDAERPGFEYEGAPALGSIGRDDPAVIDALLLRARAGPDAVRTGAIVALGHAGPPMAGRQEAALDILVGATYKPALVYAATRALASVGCESELALRRVLELASPRPPRWRDHPMYREGRFDETLCERGEAISALGHFRRFSAEVVPVLIDAFDTFEEFGPDWDEDGEHQRVCRALAAFGSAAVAAVPRLARYLDELLSRPDADHRAPNEVCRLLASLGASASASLPVLDRLRAARACANETASDPRDPDEPIDQAILAIRGEF